MEQIKKYKGGFRKGYTPWNKGIKLPYKTWQVGKNMPEKTKDKISKTLKGRISPQKGIKRKPEWNAKTSASLKGMFAKEKHPMWNGGTSTLRMLIYTTPEYKLWRRRVYERDAFTCQKCGKLSEGDIEAHHIHSVKQMLIDFNLKDMKSVLECQPFWDINNGLTLCLKCHKQTDNYGKKGKTKTTSK